MNKHLGFTLAEVLITLGIIGVVAAMTLPTLINSYRAAEARTRLLKAYSMISQAGQKMIADGEIPPAKDSYGQHQFKPIFMKYFKVLKDCGLGYNDVEEACIPSNTRDTTRIQPYKIFSNKRSLNTGYIDDGQFISTDGMLFLIENSNAEDLFVSVDINGQNKNPNIWGQDLFTFEFTSSGKLLPMGAEGTSYTDLDEYCSTTSSSGINGIACTNQAITDIDYFKKL